MLSFLFAQFIFTILLILGILLWELWTGGKTPYPTFTNSQVLDEVLMGYRLERPKLCPPEIYDLMRKCWLPVSSMIVFIDCGGSTGFSSKHS